LKNLPGETHKDEEIDNPAEIWTKIPVYRYKDLELNHSAWYILQFHLPLTLLLLITGVLLR
jgi:hypothetical protein